MPEASFKRLVEAFQVVPTSLKEVMDIASAVACCQAQGAIDRNYDFLVLGGEDRVGKYIGQDHLTQSRLEDIRMEADKAYCKMLHLGEAVTTLINSGVSEANYEAHQAKEKLSALLERLKEHALHNEKVRDKVWAITGGKCFYCSVELVRCAEGNDRSRLFHIDHLVAKANGGPDHIANYVPACETCNISKGSKPYVEFMIAKRERLCQEVLGR